MQIVKQDARKPCSVVHSMEGGKEYEQIKGRASGKKEGGWANTNLIILIL